MPTPRFPSLAADLRDLATAERKQRAARTDELLMYALDSDVGPQTRAAVLAIAAIPQVFDADVVVLLQALTAVMARHNMHQPDRCDLVDELQLIGLGVQEQIEADVEWCGAAS